MFTPISPLFTGMNTVPVATSASAYTSSQSALLAERRSRGGVCVLIALALSYSCFGLISNLSYSTLGTFTQVMVRSGVALILFLIWSPGLVRALCQMPQKDWLLLLVRSFVMYGVSIPCFVAAVGTGHLGSIAILAALPFSAAWGYLLYDERPSKSYWFGLLIAIGGLIPLVGGEGNISSREGTYAIVSSVTFALGLVLRRSHETVNDHHLNGGLLFLGILWCSLGAILSDEGLPDQSIDVLWLNLGAGLLVAVNAHLASIGFQRVSASTAGALLMLEPVFATILGAIVLGQGITASGVVGGLCVLSGVLVPPFWENLRHSRVRDRTYLRCRGACESSV